MHCARNYLCIKLQIKIHISLHLIVIWNRTRAYILVCIWETFWNIMHSYIHAQFAALIAFFLGNFTSYAHSFVCAYLLWCDQSVRREHSDGWQDRKVCFTDIQPNSISLFYRSSFGWCTFSALIWLAPGDETKLQCTSEKSRWMRMQNNTPVPRLNKGFSCKEKGD